MLTAADMVFFMSELEGSSGGAMSTLQIPTAEMCRIFGDVTRLQAKFGGVDYRKVFLVNTNPTASLDVARMWFLMQPGIGNVMAMGLGSETDTDGTLISYTSPTDYSNALYLGDLPAGKIIPIWFQRVVTAGTKHFDRAFFQLALTGKTILGA